MSIPTNNNLPKRPHPPSPLRTSSSSSSLPNKRICKSPTPAAIQTILHLPEDAVFSLRKADLREYFLLLREYALNPYPLPLTLPSPSTPPTASITPLTSPPTPIILPQPAISPLLSLPLELRLKIYKHLFPPPSQTPIPGPHPRPLQSPLLLTQSFPSSLLALSHQIRREALPLLWGCPTQVVHITIDYAIWLHKTQRSELVLSSEVVRAIRHVHVQVHLGREKVRSKPGEVEREARVGEVRKGIRKVGKWLSGADVQTMKISWQEPPQTYTWKQKREILEGLKVLHAVKVDAGEINWGLGSNWNKGRKYRFEIEYLKELERGHGDDGSI